MRFPHSSHSAPSPPVNTGSQYFDRRGEVNELKQALRTAIAERNSESLRDNIRKVIMYMTLGIDMSRLFSEMVMVSQMGDTVQKKMVYLYLTTYAEENADLAILAVNTLQKDTKDLDPSVRGLALRSLCSLQLPNMVEYLEPAISAGLSDPSGYVRKTAVLGVLKLSHISTNISSFKDRIVTMLPTDSDSMVVSNCIAVLSELDAISPLIDRALVYALLNRFPQLTEWGRCQAMDAIVSRYFPADDEELFNLMNALDTYLRQSSAPVSFGIFKLFLSWTSTNPDLYHSVMDRILDPILTLLSASCTSLELQHAILSQIELMTINSKYFRSLLTPHWKTFMLSDTDSFSSSKTKLTILSLMEGNDQVIAEVASYILAPQLTGPAVDALVCLARASDVARVVDLLVDAAQTQPKISGMCMKGIANLMRKYPDNAASQLADLEVFIETSLENFLTSELTPSVLVGLENLAWILADFDLPDAPYQLERIFEYESQQEEMHNELTKLIIGSVIKLFIKRPIECRNLLEKIFQFGIDQCADPDTRDTALMYYRMFRVMGPKAVDSSLFMTDNLVALTPTPSDPDDLLVDFNK